MKARSALGGLALVLGMTLPAAAQAPAATPQGADGLQLAQAPAGSKAQDSPWQQCSVR